MLVTCSIGCTSHRSLILYMVAINIYNITRSNRGTGDPLQPSTSYNSYCAYSSCTPYPAPTRSDARTVHSSGKTSSSSQPFLELPPSQPAKEEEEKTQSLFVQSMCQLSRMSLHRGRGTRL